MKTLKIILLFAGLLLLVDCEKSSSDGLHGRWEPVYAYGSGEDEVYIYSFDGPVDEHGQLPMTMVGKENPDIKYENIVEITGIRFFRKNGEDVFITFHKDNPKKEIGKPLLYKIENGTLYREWPKGAFINGHLEELQEGSGVFDEGAPISFLGNGQIKIGGVTYSKK